MAQAKIVIFSALYMPHLGGVEKFSQSIAAELSKTDQVTVFCMNTEKQLPFYCEEGNVKVYYLPCFSLQTGRFPVPNLSAIQFLWKWFNQNQIDFGIVQCRFYILSLVGCILFSKHQIPFIQIEHGAGDIIMPNPIVNNIWHCYDKLLTKWELQYPHDFYSVSKAGLHWLEHYGIHGAGVISNSIAPADFAEALQNPGSWKRENNIPDDKLLITFTGRIMKEKGVIDLLEAIDRLNRNDIFLVIAGDGDRKLIQKWVNRKDILFTGKIPFSQIPKLLTDTAIYCLPSHFIEGKPTGVLEAGICGNAVIATASGGTLEIVPNNNFGRLIEAGDVNSLTKNLEELLNHPNERKRIGDNLHNRVLEKFTWETAAHEVHKAMSKYGL